MLCSYVGCLKEKVDDHFLCRDHIKLLKHLFNRDRVFKDGSQGSFPGVYHPKINAAGAARDI